LNTNWLNLQLDLFRDDLRLAFPYLYYHIFSVRWSSTTLDDQTLKLF